MTLRFSTDQGVFSVRAGAIVIRDNSILLAHNDRDNYYYTVGGGVEFGETTEQTICREIHEELGTTPLATYLIAVQEDFWRIRDEYPNHQGDLCHELSFFFRVELPDDFEIDPTHVDPDDQDVHELFSWVPLANLADMTIYPSCIAELAATDPGASSQHSVTNGVR